MEDSPKEETLPQEEEDHNLPLMAEHMCHETNRGALGAGNQDTDKEIARITPGWDQQQNSSIREAQRSQGGEECYQSSPGILRRNLPCQ